MLIEGSVDHDYRTPLSAMAAGWRKVDRERFRCPKCSSQRSVAAPTNLRHLRHLLALIVLSGVSAIACGPEPIRVGPRLPDDTASCASACDHLLAIGCEEGKPLEDGTSCKDFCEATQNAGHALNPSCIAHVRACAEMATVCGQGR